MISLENLRFWHTHEDASGSGGRYSLSQSATAQARKRGVGKKMMLTSVLNENVIKVGLSGTTKDEIIHEMIDILDAAGKLPDRAKAEKAVLDREHTMSTGMQHGIAIPHGKTDSVSELVAALGIAPSGIDFDSVDKESSRIFFITLSPASKSGPHLLFMAGITRLLQDQAVRQAMLAASDASEVLKIIADHGV